MLPIESMGQNEFCTIQVIVIIGCFAVDREFVYVYVYICIYIYIIFSRYQKMLYMDVGDV